MNEDLHRINAKTAKNDIMEIGMYAMNLSTSNESSDTCLIISIVKYIRLVVAMSIIHVTGDICTKSSMTPE